MEKKLWIAKYRKRSVLDQLLTLEGYWSAPPSEHDDSASESTMDGDDGNPNNHTDISGTIPLTSAQTGDGISDGAGLNAKIEGHIFSH